MEDTSDIPKSKETSIDKKLTVQRVKDSLKEQQILSTHCSASNCLGNEDKDCEHVHVMVSHFHNYRLTVYAALLKNRRN